MINPIEKVKVTDLFLSVTKGAVVRIIQDADTVYIKLYMDGELVSYCSGWTKQDE